VQSRCICTGLFEKEKGDRKRKEIKKGRGREELKNTQNKNIYKMGVRKKFRIECRTPFLKVRFGIERFDLKFRKR
jgi:hypothetical protein